MGGIVARRRQGRTVVYRISEPSIEQLCAIVCASVLTPNEAGATARAG